MIDTIRPRQSTQPPSTFNPRKCAYADLLDRISAVECRTGNLALATAIALENCDSSCSSELAERLYDAVRYSR